VAEHMARAREAVEQQQMGRLGRAGLPIEDLQTVHVGGAIGDSSHHTSPSERVSRTGIVCGGEPLGLSAPLLLLCAWSLAGATSYGLLQSKTCANRFAAHG